MKNGILAVLLLSIALVAAPSTAQDTGSCRTGISEPEKANHKQAIEYKIAGLRPGKDSMDKAYRRFHKYRVLNDSPPDSAIWWNPCTQQMLTVSFDTNHIILAVKIEPAPQPASFSIAIPEPLREVCVPAWAAQGGVWYFEIPAVASDNSTVRRSVRIALCPAPMTMTMTYLCTASTKESNRAFLPLRLRATLRVTK